MHNLLISSVLIMALILVFCFFFQAEDGIRDLVRSRGLGDVYKRQLHNIRKSALLNSAPIVVLSALHLPGDREAALAGGCLLYTSDAADERSSVDLGGRRIIKQKNTERHQLSAVHK